MKTHACVERREERERGSRKKVPDMNIPLTNFQSVRYGKLTIPLVSTNWLG